MRDIKFRAYYKTDKRIYEVLYLDFASNELRLWDEETELDFECSFEDVELMQYTGLKDKNDKEIYEGYIVHFKTLRSKEYIGEVKSYEDAASFFVVAKEHYMECLDDVYDLEVLGNIYENKELLDE